MLSARALRSPKRIRLSTCEKSLIQVLTQYENNPLHQSAIGDFQCPLVLDTRKGKHHGVGESASRSAGSE